MEAEAYLEFPEPPPPEQAADDLARGAFEQHWQQTIFRVLAEEFAELRESEKRLAKIWPQMAAAAEDEILQAVLETFAHQNARRLTRLELAARLMGITAEPGSCLTVDGMLVGVDETIKENRGGAGRDFSLLCCTQRIAHYLISTYCCARDFAQLLGMDYAVKILQHTIDEEATMETRLANLGELLYPKAQPQIVQ